MRALVLLVLVGCGQPGPVPIADALAAIADPLCERLARCYPDDFVEKLGDHNGCVAFVTACADCPTEVDPDDFEACLAWVESSACDTETPAACAWGEQSP